MDNTSLHEAVSRFIENASPILNVYLEEDSMATYLLHHAVDHPEARQVWHVLWTHFEKFTKRTTF